jgi:xanthine dehydrogenase YagS FAD-binding subunit
MRGVQSSKGVGDGTLFTYRIGALTTLGELERHTELRQVVSGLVKATARVATPQIRNVGTLGGNLLQDSRCSYYRGPWYCYRAGGIQCDAHHGINKEHAIFGGNRCYTVTLSDIAPILVALDAVAQVRNSERDVEVPLANLFTPPDENITTMHRLKADEILTEIVVRVRARQRSTFIKYAMRNGWDFALASVAVALRVEHDLCREVRIVLGGVAPVPWRSLSAEQALEGNSLSVRQIDAAAHAATEGARPLQHNEYKVALVRKLVRSALTELMGDDRSDQTVS